MIPWELIGTGRVPKSKGRPGQSREISAGTELRLYKHGDEFSIRVENWELMNSRSFDSEKHLAELACEAIRERKNACVLVGGLGLGFTARAALDLLGEDGRVVVAEIVPEVIEWNKGPVKAVAEAPLDDPRTTVEPCDVADLIRAGKESYDAILLDVDNGPDSARGGNSEGWIYSKSGLRAACSALRPGGVLTVWSAGAARGFTPRLNETGFTAHEVRSRGRGGKGNRYVIWVATKR